MPVGIVKVDALWITAPPGDLDAGILERGFDGLVFAACQAERDVIDLASGVNIAGGFKQRDPLAAALEKALPGTLVIDFHAEKVDVKPSRPGKVLDVKNYMVDSRYVES